MSPFLFAFKQLTYDRVRMLTAIAGVLFSCVLIFMQLGFRDTLFYSATMMQRKMQGDIFLVHSQSEAMWRMEAFPRTRLYQTLSIPEVEGVAALLVGQSRWKSPTTGIGRTAFVLGVEPDKADYYQFDGFIPQADKLKLLDTVLFDERSRPEFGPIAELLQKGLLSTEINGRLMDVAGLIRIGITFSADGNIITSNETFLRMFPNVDQNYIHAGIIKLKPGADIKKVQKQIQDMMIGDVLVMTQKEYIRHEQSYWSDVAPLGMIFNMGAFIGFIVGFILVYQVLFNDVTNHLSEYATLKALGYRGMYFIFVVFWSSMLIAVIGFVPGTMFSYVLYQIVARTTYVPIEMPPDLIAFVFSLVFIMCFLSGLLASRKLNRADPVELFT